MTVASDVILSTVARLRRFGRGPAPSAGRSRRRGATGLLAALGVLTACGGGSQRNEFHPVRIVVFGDETSLLLPPGAAGTGQKYTINTVSSTSLAFDCATAPIWTQYLASAYGLVFPQCDTTGITGPSSEMAAQAGAVVADVDTQVSNFVLNTGGFNGQELVTVLAGQNDILAQYRTYPAVSEAQLTANLQTAGAALAAQVNRIANAGGKVLISTVPDLGRTPYGVLERQANVDIDRAALLTRLTQAFNTKLRLGLLDDGHKIGLLLTDELFDAVTSNPGTYGYTNVINAACLPTAPLPNCNTGTLGADPATGVAATATTWLWADNLHLSPQGHQQLGQLALNRAENNPF